MDWLLFQLADSAFPTGGFVHSQGLEASSSFGVAPSIEAFVEQAAWQLGLASLPFVRAAAIAEMPFFAVCDETDAFLSNPVANRASRAQGRNWLRAAREAFADRPSIALFAESCTNATLHHAPVFGAVARALDLDAEAAQRTFLHSGVRGVVSAAVRLGRLGPLEAQRVLAASAPLFDRVMLACKDLDVSEAAQPAPLVDLAASLHDRLYTRLFQS